MATARMLGVFPLFFVCLSVCVLQCISKSQIGWNVPIKSPDVQCTERGYKLGACKVKAGDPSICEDLICVRLSSDDSYEGVFTGPAIEGTICGKSKVCKSRPTRCEDYPEAGMPNYYLYYRGEDCSRRV